jgi:hypothetical protein
MHFVEVLVEVPAHLPVAERVVRVSTLAHAVQSFDFLETQVLVALLVVYIDIFQHE